MNTDETPPLTFEQTVTNNLDTFNNVAMAFFTKVGPWLGPIPPAYLIMVAMERHLHVPTPIGVISGLAIEAAGILTAKTALRCSDWNRNKRRSNSKDPVAPTRLAIGLTACYIVFGITLSVGLEALPSTAKYFALAVFFIITAMMYIAIAINRDLAEWESKREESRAKTKLSGQISRLKNQKAKLTEAVNQAKDRVKQETTKANEAKKELARLTTEIDHAKKELTKITEVANKAKDEGNRLTSGQGEANQSLSQIDPTDKKWAITDLTTRQKAILNLLAANPTNEELASEVGTSVGTIKNELSLLRKTGLVQGRKPTASLNGVLSASRANGAKNGG